MATVRIPPPRTKSLSDPEFKKRLQATAADRQLPQLVLPGPHLRSCCCWSIGGAIWFYQFTRAYGLSLAWNVPVFAVAIVMVGALQHHLANLAHEAVHHTLFKNRYFNDLASNGSARFRCSARRFTTDCTIWHIISS